MERYTCFSLWALSWRPNRFQVSITTQPPLKTVYQRILKPFPTVTLTVAAPPKSHKSSRRRSRSSPLSDDEGDDADGNSVAPKAEGELEPGCADVLGTWHFFAPGLLALPNHLTFSSQIAETLLANSSNSSSNGLFVEATLLRGDNGEPISKCLDGNSIVRFEVRLISTIVSFVSPYNHVHVNTFAQLVLPPTRRKTPGPKACTRPRSRS